MTDLDPAALALARKRFVQKSSDRPFSAHIPKWDDAKMVLEALTGDKAQDIRNRAFDAEHHKRIIWAA